MANKKQTFSLLREVDVVHMLAFIGGFIDAAGYMKANGVFTASITGNLVVITTSLTSPYGVICRAVISFAFFFCGAVGVFTSTRLRNRHRLSPTATSACLFGLEFALLFLSGVVGKGLDDRISQPDNLDEWSVIWVTGMLGGAMGFHNAAARETIANCPATTVMTTTLITIGTNAANAVAYWLELLSLDADQKSSTLGSKTRELCNSFADKFIVTLKPLVFFMIGAIVGSVTMFYGSFWCISVPLFLLLLIISDLLYTTWLACRPVPVDSDVYNLV